VTFQAKLARDMGLTSEEIAVFRKLGTPSKIQDYVSAMPTNFEEQGETCYSVRAALRESKCHCIEGAFIAACALMLHGRPALLLDFQAKGDDDHVCALFKQAGCWGAISKSNSIWLRWRDPVYRSVRELAMSCFHEYVKETRKTLRRISKPFDIGAYRPEDWITGEQCWNMAREIDRSPHVALITAAQARGLRRRDAFEQKADSVKQTPPPRGWNASW
jgi:hypothetical protein